MIYFKAAKPAYALNKLKYYLNRTFIVYIEY